jgi:hypothetical protein
MRLGVPFIAPRQLGAVGSPFGRQFLLSVGWRTEQSGRKVEEARWAVHLRSSAKIRAGYTFLVFQSEPSI